jgi:quercetin dioxygenase-like cupin family protein
MGWGLGASWLGWKVLDLGEGEGTMEKFTAIRRGELGEGPATPGIVRQIAFQNGSVTVIRAHTEPGMLSGWHTHTDHHIYGYVASGKARFEYRSGDTQTVEIGPGDFFHLSPQTVHRESNPSPDEPSEILLFITGEGPLVENLEEKEDA